MIKFIHTEQSKNFTERIKEHRKKSGLNQRELALKLDVPRSTVARIELGERRVELFEYIEILEALDVDPVLDFIQLTHLLKKHQLQSEAELTIKHDQRSFLTLKKLVPFIAEDTTKVTIFSKSNPKGINLEFDERE